MGRVPAPLHVGRKHETEFRIDLHSPTTGDVLSLAVIGSRQSAANLAALAYAREQTPEDPSWRTLSILSEPPWEIESMSREEMLSDEF
jgi:hypothetical protein